VLCLADGLGHGQAAQEAAQAAVDFVGRNSSLPLDRLFAECDKALRATRGVAMGVARIDREGDRLVYAGIGNTRCMVVGQRLTRLSNGYGIVGAGYKRLPTESVKLDATSMVLMWTDGVEELISPESLVSGSDRTVAQLAHEIIETWGVARDDSGVLIWARGGESS